MRVFLGFTFGVAFCVAILLLVACQNERRDPPARECVEAGYVCAWTGR